MAISYAQQCIAQLGEEGARQHLATLVPLPSVPYAAGPGMYNACVGGTAVQDHPFIRKPDGWAFIDEMEQGVMIAEPLPGDAYTTLEEGAADGFMPVYDCDDCGGKVIRHDLISPNWRFCRTCG